MSGLQDYGDHDGLGLADLVRRGEVSPQELVEAALAAMDRLNPQLNAVVRRFDETARAAAEGPLPDGPFQGVPFLVKDLLVSVAGVPTDCGSRYFQGWTRDHDSEIVKRWRAAGLIFVGKSNTPELGANGATEPVFGGATKNPWNPGHTPGGSTGGGAAAVAAGIVPLAHANDAGGSIRGPASCCGLVGLKPTRGRNSLAPDAGEYWNGLVAEHVVSRSLRDTAALLDATAGPVPGDPHVAPAPERPYLKELNRPAGRLRIGFATSGPKGEAFHPECLAGLKKTAALLETLGHDVEEAAPRWDADLLGEALMAIFAVAVARDVAEREAATAIPPSNEVLEKNCLWLFEKGKALSAIELSQAVSKLNQVSRQFAPFFEDYDCWLTPTMAQLPPEEGHLNADVDDVPQFFERLWHFNPLNSVYNVTGLPAISLPLQMSESGLPIGMMLGAGFGREDLLFRLSAQLEEAAPWRDRHPPISLWSETA